MVNGANQMKVGDVPAWGALLHERRASPRYPFVQDLILERLDRPGRSLPGTGKTLNMSSGGILFETDVDLHPGEVLQMTIRWPAQLDNRCEMKIVVQGKVVRCSECRTAVEILQYSFKTAGRNGLSL